MENKEIKKVLDFNPQLYSVSRDSIARLVANAFDSGNYDPIELALYLKSVGEGIIEATKLKPVQDCIANEIKKYGREAINGITKYGKTVKIAITYTEYDYKESNHTELREINKILLTLRARKHQIEEELKKMKEGSKATVVVQEVPRLVWEQSGEVIEIYAPPKSTKTGLKFTNY